MYVRKIIETELFYNNDGDPPDSPFRAASTPTLEENASHHRHGAHHLRCVCTESYQDLIDAARARAI